jgi:hypothetical protein
MSILAKPQPNAHAQTTNTEHGEIIVATLLKEIGNIDLDLELCMTAYPKSTVSCTGTGHKSILLCLFSLRRLVGLSPL